MHSQAGAMLGCLMLIAMLFHETSSSLSVHSNLPRFQKDVDHALSSTTSKPLPSQRDLGHVPLFVALLSSRNSFTRSADTYKDVICLRKFKLYSFLSKRHSDIPLISLPRRGCNVCANIDHEGVPYDWFLKQALLSQVYDLVKETPIQHLPVISNELNNQVFAKREELQTGFSFCTRGAHHLLLNLTMKTRPSGIVVASAGNYGHGVSLSAKYLGIKCVNVVPENTNGVKIRNLKRNSDVIAFGSQIQDSINFAKQLAKMEGHTFVSLDDPLMIAGHATISVEILRQSKQNFDYIFVPIGTGNLAKAIGTYLKRLKPNTKIIGVAMQNSDLQLKYALDTVPRINVLDDVVYVDSAEVKNSILDYYEDTRTVLEQYGALSIAGARKWLSKEGVVNSRVLLLVTGSNVDLQDAASSQFDNHGHWEEEEADEFTSGAISHGIMPSSFVRFVPKQSKSCKYGLRIVQPEIIHSTPSKLTVGLGVSQLSRWDAADHFGNLVYEGRA
uniref:Tryptophan synthase beta chain-like PALP domain-containing protein n=1 Tax=Hanusia phi TaxID=3032 RepID=A0A7S0ETW3_9CRYP